MYEEWGGGGREAEREGSRRRRLELTKKTYTHPIGRVGRGGPSSLQSSVLR